MSKRKTGLMYVPGAASYKAGDGYLCIPSAYSPWISTTDYMVALSPCWKAARVTICPSAF